MRIYQSLRRLLGGSDRGPEPDNRQDVPSRSIGFGFDSFECCELYSGSCPIEDMTEEELTGPIDSGFGRRENDRLYCPYLAKKMIEGDDRYLGHGMCDGRHRECAAERLLKRGIEVHPYVSEP